MVEVVRALRKPAKAPVLGLLLLCALNILPAQGRQLDKGIFLPEDAQPVRSLRWKDITSFTPLSRELVLVRTRERPYLLTLKRACPGLRSDSIFVTEQENGYFEPERDLLSAAAPPNSGVSPIILNGTGKFSRNGLMEGTVRCRPDALYAITEEGLTWVEEVIEEQRGTKKRKRQKD